MDLGIKGKTALVTGAGSGIGAAVARSFCKEHLKMEGVCHQKGDFQSTHSLSERIAIGSRYWRFCNGYSFRWTKVEGYLVE